MRPTFVRFTMVLYVPYFDGRSKIEFEDPNRRERERAERTRPQKNIGHFALVAKSKCALEWGGSGGGGGAGSGSGPLLLSFVTDLCAYYA